MGCMTGFPAASRGSHNLKGLYMRKLFFALTAILLAAAVTSARAADTSKGAQTYALHCQSCHGRTGVSGMPGAPNLARGEGLMQPDMMLLASIKTGKNAMPGYMGILKDQDILDVIAYSRTLIGTVSNLNR